MEERLWRTGLGLLSWGLVVGCWLAVPWFINLEGTFSDFPPLWLRHLSRGGGEKRLAGRRRFWAWLVVFPTQPLCGWMVGRSITHRGPTEGRRWALTEERHWRMGFGAWKTGCLKTGTLGFAVYIRHQ